MTAQQKENVKGLFAEFTKLDQFGLASFILNILSLVTGPFIGPILYIAEQCMKAVELYYLACT